MNKFSFLTQAAFITFLSASPLLGVGHFEFYMHPDEFEIPRSQVINWGLSKLEDSSSPQYAKWAERFIERTGRIWFWETFPPVPSPTPSAAPPEFVSSSVSVQPFRPAGYTDKRIEYTPFLIRKPSLNFVTYFYDQLIDANQKEEPQQTNLQEKNDEQSHSQKSTEPKKTQKMRFRWKPTAPSYPAKTAKRGSDATKTSEVMKKLRLEVATIPSKLSS